MLMKRYLVTGNRGYIGENMVQYLEGLDDTEEVVGFDLVDDQDIRNYSALKVDMEGIDICFHLAAISGIKACDENRADALSTNVTGTFNVLEAAKEHDAKVILTSTFACQDPSNFYAHTKAMGERLFYAYSQYIGRLSNVYGGPNYLESKGTVVAKFIKNQKLTVHGDGSQKRDFIHVKDVVRNLHRIVDEYEPGLCKLTRAYPFNVNSGKLTEISTLARMVQGIKGGEIVYTDDDSGISSTYVKPIFPASRKLQMELIKLIQGFMKI